MTSQKQIEANRLNSKKSTGPTSGSGKSVVARNAIRHGILSEHLALDELEDEQYNHFRTSMQAQLQPQNDMQYFLADRIISTAWRLRRTVHIETLMFKKAYNSSYKNKSYEDAFSGQLTEHMNTLSRYEKFLESALFRAIKEFHSLKAESALDVFYPI